MISAAYIYLLADIHIFREISNSDRRYRHHTGDIVDIYISRMMSISPV